MLASLALGLQMGSQMKNSIDASQYRSQFALILKVALRKHNFIMRKNFAIATAKVNRLYKMHSIVAAQPACQMSANKSSCACYCYIHVADFLDRVLWTAHAIGASIMA